jgi:hypothetical protein
MIILSPILSPLEWDADVAHRHTSFNGQWLCGVRLLPMPFNRRSDDHSRRVTGQEGDPAPTSTNPRSTLERKPPPLQPHPQPPTRLQASTEMEHGMGARNGGLSGEGEPDIPRLPGVSSRMA